MRVHTPTIARRPRYKPVGLLLLLLLSVCFALGRGFLEAPDPALSGTEVTVMQVIDGDSCVVHLTDGTERTVRLYGVDAPEGRQRYGMQAAAFARDHALSKQFRMDVEDVDQYGRCVALLFPDTGESLNERMVRTGHAWVYRQYCTRAECAAWLEAERNAKASRLGLWKDRHPVPPWKWRKDNPRPDRGKR